MSRQPAYRILILGGYGHFGARITRALAGSREARPCLDLMTLEEFEAAVEHLDIRCSAEVT